MPGPIITAGKAKTRYTGKSIKEVAGKISIKNSSGKRVSVAKNTKVYHRGKGNFGLYTTAADNKRSSRGSTSKDQVGSGSYRHTSDRKKTATTKKAPGQKKATTATKAQTPKRTAAKKAPGPKKATTATKAQRPKRTTQKKLF